MHEHDHADHDHDDHAHPHPTPSDHDAVVSEFELLERAIRSLLIDKGVLTAEEIHAQIDFMDTRNPALGARIVAKAWSDPAFKRRLIKDPRATLLAEGIDIGTIADFKVVENAPKVHNVVVCTLCSCYPKGLLGIPPAWYKSAPYRSRVVVDPRGVLQEFGLEISEDVEVRVHDSTAELRYVVLPMRPKGTEALSERQLAKLISRDCLIGTAVPRAPGSRAAGRSGKRTAA